VSAGALEAADGGVLRPGHRPRLDAGQEAASAQLEGIFSQGGLAPPLVDELPATLVERRDFWSLVRRLETLDVVRQVADGLYVRSEELDLAAARIRRELGGRTNLGPADFREALPVSRKHLIPLLNYFDGRGTTVRGTDGRDVPQEG
jgi:selenocysteine-specific elongation factor